MYSLKDGKNPLNPVLTVSALTNKIRDTLESDFDNVFVVGEISNAKVYPSGHWYFSMKDQEATLPCVCFKNSNSSLKFKLEDGLMMVARGKLSVYPPRGAYQMIVTSLEPVGVGEWQLAFEQLKAKLTQEGLLDPARKKAIPLLPRRVGVVTSPVGAALRDILSAISRRNKTVSVLISPAKVQGDGSAEDVARAIKLLEEESDLDVIIVARGGGSIEDLWSFNTEVVARAVAQCSIPIISGVGHETDTTICDLVADLRAPTPTAAAELVARGSAELLEKWSFLNIRLLGSMTDRLTRARRMIERLSPANALNRYADRLALAQVNLARRKQHMINRIERLVQAQSSRRKELFQELQALGPKNVLTRGFSVLRYSDGRVIRSIADLKCGDIVEAILSKGKVKLKVEAVEDADW
ncbi:MAG: exodeoxyribonuclease VII large subunit [Candidatus Melainabacteria bacterium]|jgi:exodeoxyribonuclease VII large subunit|nr:exodeoxyribonuclease VII large subunit [Candidatus Melainabacteria bacterium]MBX9674442.1 exodeoxyribonuclease VII large subunit [Candidatus Obscuribacterales bacterium]